MRSYLEMYVARRSLTNVWMPDELESAISRDVGRNYHVSYLVMTTADTDSMPEANPKGREGIQRYKPCDDRSIHTWGRWDMYICNRTFRN